MNERNVAYGADSLYPRDRVFNMSREDNGNDNDRREREERAKKERGDREEFAKGLLNPESLAEEKIRKLKEITDGGFHRDLGIPKAIEDLVVRGELPKVPDVPKPPIPLEGRSQIVGDGFLVDKSGATVVVQSDFSPKLKREQVEEALERSGNGAKIPAKWEKMGLLRQSQWLQENNVLISSVIPENEELSMLPEIRGGSGEVPWDDPLLVTELKPTRNDPNHTETREITVRENFDRLLYLVNKNDTESKDYRELRDRLDENVESLISAGVEGSTEEKNYLLLSDIIKASEYLSYRYDAAGRTDLFEEVVTKETRDKLKKIQHIWNDQFRNEYKENPDKYDELFKNLKEESAQVISIQDYGLYGRADDYRERFNHVADNEIASAVSVDDREMLRWRKVVLQEGFDTHFAEKEILQPTADWRDSEKNLDQILRFLESTEFDDQQLSAKLGAAAKIVQGIPVDTLKGSEKAEAEEMQKYLTDKLQAIVAVNSFYSAMEHGDMNPEKVMGVLGHIKDHSFEIFFERFSKDSKGKALKYKDKDGKEKDLNILSVGMNVYMRRFNFERRVMNFIEDWTKNPNLQPNFKDKDLEAACGAAMHVIKAEMKQSSMKDSIAKWYRENTMLGSHDHHTKEIRKDEMIGDKHFGEEHADEHATGHGHGRGVKVWSKGLIEELRERKEEWGLTDEKIKEMVDAGTIDQVMNNAYRISWMTGFSEYDGIRIWDPNEDNPLGGKGRQVAFVYNGSTELFHGRMVDHAWEFYIDEKRGKVPKTNFLMQNELLGESGNLLPQNRTMVRFARMLMGDDAADQYVMDKKRGGFKNLDKFDPKNKEEMGWAESAIMSEGIDKGELSFDNADWAQFFKSTNSWKYRWIDLYGDRKAMMDYMGAGVLQKYLQQPNSEMFFQINSLENFYSKREVRLQPWMKLAIGAHQKIGDRWKEWWGLSERMTHAEKEAVIEIAAATNRLDPDYKNAMKRRNLGWGGMPGVMPVRGLRQFGEAVDIFAREYSMGVGKGWWRFGAGWSSAFFGQGMKYILS